MDHTAQTDQVFNKFHKRKVLFPDLGGQFALQPLDMTVCALSALLPESEQSQKSKNDCIVALTHLCLAGMHFE